MNFKNRLKQKIHKGKVVLKEEGFLTFLFHLAKFCRRKAVRVVFGKTPSREYTAKELFYQRFPSIQEIKHISIEGEAERINLVTDSLDNKSLFGGVVTSLILAISYANKHNIALRIITRETKNNPEDFESFLRIQGLKKPENLEYFSDYDRNKPGNIMRLEVSNKDIFITTSWCSTYVVKELTTKNKIFYLLQEVESFFYPYGDEHYLCEEALRAEGVYFIINSSYLNDFYMNSRFKNINKNSISFEPAFSGKLYYPSAESFKKKNKYNLFFYARPNNPRNLFYYGIKLINEAIELDLIDAEQWNIYFAGSKLPKIALANDVKPQILGQMNWGEYSEFIKTVDLGICLMYTPHPSYPPLDIVTSGGVVLTNKFLNKQSLYYSKNIICSELDKKEMLKNLEKTVNLAKNANKREENYKKNQIQKDWNQAFEEVFTYMEQIVKGEENANS